MRVLSLFSGMGGFDLGLELAGMEIVGQVEIDKDCLRVLGHHWPVTWRSQDVKSVHAIPFADLICAGVPCQDWSVAGKRAGIEGARSGLFFEFVRIIREMREASGGRFPKYAVFENVPGLYSASGGRDFGTVLNELAQCGAVDIAWRTIDSQHWVPQRRRRVFVVACFPPASVGDSPIGRASEILAITEGCTGHPEKGRAQGEDVAGTLGGGAQERGWPDDTDRMTFVPEVAHPINARDSKGVNQREDVMTYLAVRTAQTSVNGHGIADDVAHTLDGVNGQAIAHTLRADGFDAGEDGTGRGTPIVPSGVSVRRLTPTECARLQNFPDGWLELDCTYGTEGETHAREVLRRLWDEARTAAREGWRSAIAAALFSPEILLSGLYERWLSWALAYRIASHSDRQGKGEQTWPEGFMLRLRRFSDGSPPQGREPFEQLAGELGRSLSSLPLDEASCAATLLGSRLWPQAQAEWPLRPSFSTRQEKRTSLSDGAQYRMLGNAVTTAVIQWIGERIMACER